MANEIEGKIILTGDDRTVKMWGSATANMKKFSDAAMRMSGSWGLPKVAGALGDVTRAAGGVARALAPAITAIGTLTGITVGGGFAALVAGLKASSERIDELSKKARQLGLPLQTLREFKYVADLQGVAWDNLDAGLTKAASGYASIQMHTGKLYTQLGKISPALRKQIEGAKSASEAYNIMFGAIHNAKDKATKIKLAELFFGDSDFTKIAELSASEIKKMMKDFDRLSGTITDKQGSAVEDLNDNVSRLWTSLQGVSDTIAVKLLPKLDPVITATTNWVAANRDLTATKVVETFDKIAAWAQSVDWVQIGSDLSGLASSVNSVVTATTGWANALAGLAVAPLVLPVLGLAVAVGKLGWALASTPAGALLAIGAAAAYVGWQNWDAISEHFTKAGNAWEEAGAKFKNGETLDGFRALRSGFAEAEAGIDTWVAKMEQATGLDKLKAWDKAMTDSLVAGIKAEWAAVDTAWQEWSANFRAAAVSLGKDLMMSIANGITSMAMAPVDAAAGVADDLFKRFKGWFLPTPQYPQLYGPQGIPQLPNVKLHAKGGPVHAGGYSIVGEQGPELVRWGASGSVINAATTAALTSSTSASAAGMAFARAMAPPFDRLNTTMERLISTISTSPITAGGGGSGGFGFGGGAGGFGGSSGSGGFGAPGIAAKNLGSSKNAGSWMNFLMKDMGAPKWLASAAVAGLMGESGVNLNSGAIGDGGTSGGTAQWHNERWAGLRRFAASMGKAWTDVGVQQAWFKHEMQTKYAAVWKRMMASGNAYGALDAYVRGYEVPANPGGEVRKRSGYVPGLMSGDWQPAIKTTHTQPAAAPIPQPVNIGRGELKVTIKSHGGSVTGLSMLQPENIDVSAGVDHSGRKLWRPHPGQA